MKHFYKLFFCCFFTIVTNAQDSLDCKFNFREALIYLKGSEYVEKDSIRAVELLRPCVASEDADAQTLMARLYLNSSNEENIKKGFKLTKKAAKQDHALATHDLGVLFKYGKGKDQNLKKAVKWFKKSHEFGNSKAAYSIGYMHFKGFGDLEQDYNKANRWFKKSDYPMAKHWLAVSHYFGYGVTQNKNKAIRLLNENDTEKSKILLASLERITKDTQLEEDEAFLLNELKVAENKEEELEIDDLKGNWVGSLIQLDWSKSTPMQKIPITLNFEKDSILDDVSYKMFLGDNEYNGEVTSIGSTVYFENFSLNLEHPYSSNVEKNIDYQVISNNLISRVYNNDEYIILSTKTFIEPWKESGAPMIFVLRKEKAVTENNVEITDEALEALEAQNSFVKLYPNPFENDLIIAYQLDTPGNVSVRITSIDGSRTDIVKNGNHQNSGEYIYHFNGSSLKNGMYIISVMVDGSQNTKMILKK